MIAIVDYGVGNLFSLRSSLSAVGAEVAVTGDGDVLRRADKIILPGVGAFGDAAAKLRATGLDAVVIAEAKAGKPLLGICLGMQLLLERSLEYGEHAGLGLIPGDVVPLSPPDGLKVPHMGWNALQFSEPRSPIFRELNPGDHVYFVHSFHAANCPCVTATAEYGIPVTAAVGKDNVFGCQFHPEKSGPVGLSILKSFCEL
ncbi:MAG TPA: imidazole glycerol phosphate synthase subunit HisH [Candidatus Avoscillospira avistercoris]|uniref:Imidazole glycerol phosphate synthase subunit HisH n=1 Tax=Candidatus Avoscillospira avistercoris TaxID=2840707 RepID=A0A9D1FAM5_9FIRM|nr:imidazole glycerol phosphate synthase subunit HisH [Candidatus Avoscillospira avistercoris]